MIVSCPHPSCVGLAANVTYESLLKHLQQTCPEISVKCISRNCAAEIKRSDLIRHLITNCKDATFEC